MREGYIMKRMALACFMATYAGARVAFGGLLYEPSCYVAQESLALNLDGIRNVGALKAHDGAATEWKDLSHTANNAEFIAKEGDASAWIRAASGQGDSYTYTVGTSSAKVRLTWNALPSGTVLIVR